MSAPSFPFRAPVGFFAALFLSIFSAFAIFPIWKHFKDPVQMYYLKPYATSAAWSLVPTFGKPPRQRPYTLVFAGGYPLIPGDTFPSRSRLHLQTRLVSVVIFHAWLQHYIYNDTPLSDVLRAPLVAWAATAIILIVLGIIWDQKRRQRAREGVVLSGPKILTPRQFNRITKGDSFALRIK